MKLVNQTDVLDAALGYEESVRFLARTGFDGVDLSLMGMLREDDVWCREDYREHARALRELADREGVEFLQAHAPFPSSRGDREFDEMAFGRIVRAMEIAAIVGAPRIVVHPLIHMPYRKNREKLMDLSVEFYRRLIPYCETFGIRVCTENMWERDPNRKVITMSLCADPAEFRELLERVDSPWIGGCLDIGHCGLVGVDPADAVRTLGKEHLDALHVHDVDYFRDCHTMPFLENLDWDSIAAALKEVGYRGEFTIETHGLIKKMPAPRGPPAFS